MPLNVADHFATAQKALVEMQMVGLGKDLPADSSKGAATLENVNVVLRSTQIYPETSAYCLRVHLVLLYVNPFRPKM